MKLASLALAVLLLTALGWALEPPADLDSPGTAKNCTDAGGQPNVSPEGKYDGCTYSKPAPNQGTETLHGCKKTTGADGAANWECDCPACGHASDKVPPLVGKPDDWPTRHVGRKPSDLYRQKI